MFRVFCLLLRQFPNSRVAVFVEEQLAEVGMTLYRTTPEEQVDLAVIMRPAFAEAFQEAAGEIGEQLLLLIGQLRAGSTS